LQKLSKRLCARQPHITGFLRYLYDHSHLKV
jgi:hypothetical protein